MYFFHKLRHLVGVEIINWLIKNNPPNIYDNWHVLEKIHDKYAEKWRCSTKYTAKINKIVIGNEQQATEVSVIQQYSTRLCIGSHWSVLIKERKKANILYHCIAHSVMRSTLISVWFILGTSPSLIALLNYYQRSAKQLSHLVPLKTAHNYQSAVSPDPSQTIFVIHAFQPWSRESKVT